MTKEWGPYTWNMFHTLIIKIKDQHFDSIKNELLNKLINISYNLPCPICSKHSNEYFKKINKTKIKTKQDLSNLFFNFHNEVNKRLNKNLFLIQNLKTTYLTNNTIKVVDEFLYRFYVAINAGNLRFFNSLASKQAYMEFYNWIVNNIKKFEL